MQIIKSYHIKIFPLLHTYILQKENRSTIIEGREGEGLKPCVV